MTFIPHLHVGSGTQLESLTVFPIWVDGAGTPGLDWGRTHLDVSERAGSASVPELVVRNTGAAPLPILDGDLFVGGQQNRMAASAMLLDPEQSAVMPVRCVEQGRWSGSARHEASSLRASHSVRYGRHLGTSRLADQGEVWDRVQRFEQTFGATVSSDLVTHLDRARTPAAHPAKQIRPIDGQRGVMFGIAGRIVACEIFGSARGLRSRWRGIVDAAVLDAAHMSPVATPSFKARAFAARMASVPRRDERRTPRIRTIAAADERTAITTDWVTDAEGRRRGLMHATAYNRTHAVLQRA
ncbi:DUF6569 family protein [Microbacterium sp. HA-8]|uniref:ARPP-1 family domain-containing protein n=1 Tax=Microbacterium sp. HA-8 TaxID=3234200 RepID=UPI0038F7948D